MIKARVQIIDRGRAQSDGCQLDRQRNTVQPTADPRDGRCIGRVQREVAPLLCGAPEEQLYGVGLGELGRIVGRLRGRKRRHAIHLFASEPQGLAARRQHRHPRAAREQARNELGRGLDNLFAVVDHDEEPTIAKRLVECIQHLPICRHRHPQPRRDRRGNQPGVKHGREIDEPHAAAAAIEQLGSQPKCQASLPNPARSSQRHHSRASQKRAQLEQLAFAAHEARELIGQVRATR